MNDLRKMPEGQRDTSPRSSPSNRVTLILVFAEIEDNGICRRSRSRRSRTHSDSSGTLASTWSTICGARASSGPPGEGTSAFATHHPRTLLRRNCSVSLILFSCDGGHLVLPASGALLVSREYGGNLMVNPPRPVWERSELT